MKNQKLEQAKIELLKKYPAEIVKKAIEKSKRWQRAAYEGINWDEVEAETGSIFEHIEFYCVETMKKNDGKNTFNRGN